MAMKAFRVTCKDIGDGIYFAETASKAKLASLIAGRDAGCSISFSDLRVTRAADFDKRTCSGKMPTQGTRPECFD